MVELQVHQPIGASVMREQHQRPMQSLGFESATSSVLTYETGKTRVAARVSKSFHEVQQHGHLAIKTMWFRFSGQGYGPRHQM